MNLNKNYTYIAAAIIIFIIGIFAGRLTKLTDYSDIICNELRDYSNGDPVVDIDNDSIGNEYLNQRITLYKEYILDENNTNDPLLRDKILKKLIDSHIVLSEAQRMNIFKSDNSKKYLWIYLEEAMINYYLDFLTSVKGNSKLELSDKQVSEFYKKNKSLFDKKKMSEAQAKVEIKTILSTMDAKQKKKNRILLRKIEMGKLKKGHKIKINSEYMNKNR